jgi:hypothetical protein
LQRVIRSRIIAAEVYPVLDEGGRAMSSKARLPMVVAAAVAALAVPAASAGAAPANAGCVGALASNGAAAQTVLAAIASDTQPGLSGFDVGAFITGTLQESCGVAGG